MSAWMVWLIVAAVFLVVELATSLALVTIWFIPPALLAAGLAYLDIPLAVQILVFLVGSAVLFYFFFKFVRKGQEPTNADRIIGREAEVIEEINPLAGTGLVCIGGQIWSACVEGDKVYPKGELVKVVGILGVKAQVVPLEGGKS